MLKEIFKEPLRGMAQVQYRITGPWESPEVERIATAEDIPAESPGTAASDDAAAGNDRG